MPLFTLHMTIEVMRLFQGIFVVVLAQLVEYTLSDSSRILNGYKIDIEQAPYIVHIRFREGEHHYGFCGGSIVNERFIMSAGHCEYDIWFINFVQH